MQCNKKSLTSFAQSVRQTVRRVLQPLEAADQLLPPHPRPLLPLYCPLCQPPIPPAPPAPCCLTRLFKRVPPPTHCSFLLLYSLPAPNPTHVPRPLLPAAWQVFELGVSELQLLSWASTSPALLPSSLSSHHHYPPTSCLTTLTPSVPCCSFSPFQQLTHSQPHHPLAACQVFELGASELQLQSWGSNVQRLSSVAFDLAGIDPKRIVVGALWGGGEKGRAVGREADQVEEG